jgi:hypothetical protein
MLHVAFFLKITLSYIVCRATLKPASHGRNTASSTTAKPGHRIATQASSANLA